MLAFSSAVGCSVLYHLAKAGWTDIMLIERSELTSGSSWHAAGGFHTLNGDPNVAKLQAYTVQLYKEIEEISGQSCSLHLTGGVMMADTPERMDFLRLAHAKGRYLGMDTELITPSEAKAMFPLMDETNFVGAMWDPVEGHLDPSGTTIAYSKAAKKLGAEIVLRNRVVELTQEVDGTWNVVTEQGTVKAEHVVNCGGLWAREIGRMVGVELPVLAMEHTYVHGDPGFDVWGMDVTRFGEWAGLRYTNAKVRENYSRRFSIRFPNEELPAARPAQTTPLYDTMLANNAVMGDSWGLETPLWFAPEGKEP
ncbi:MAG: FAD-dependent oxidoreductase, partial [Mesorhizobium sp.]